MVRVFVDHIRDQYEMRINEALEWLQLDNIIKNGSRIFIKPNLTYPRFKPGVTTTPQLLKALIRILKDHGCQVIVGESDGGYNSHEIKDVFHDYGLYDIEKEYGIKVVNLSKLPYEFLKINKFGREFNVEIPKILMHEIDAFFTLPVPKVHAMTKISLSYKNQWGCIPNVMRLRYHPLFNEAIFAINQAIKNKVAIVDGTYGLTRYGPLGGDAIELGWLVASNSLEAADLIAAKMMGFNLKEIKHYYLAYKNNLVPKNDEIELNQDYQGFISNKFYLKRSGWDFLARASWLHPLINYTFYYSPVSDILHKIMYTFREKAIKD